MSKPPLGKVSVADKVWVRSGYGRSKTWVRAEVTKVARVWITTVAVDGYPNEQRFRLDDQSDGSGYTQGGHFYTIEQYEWLTREQDAIDYLNSLGICDTFRLKVDKIVLADVLRAAKVEA